MVRQRQTGGVLRLRGSREEEELTVVGFDSATGDTAVCALRDGEPLFESLVGPSESGRPLHTASLLDEVERAVEAAGGWGQVERIAVGIGPGTFTGLRVGIASARGLCLARGLPLSGVGTLDALAAGIEATAAGERDRVAVLDARRGEVFAARYAPGSAQPLWGAVVCPPEELAERLAGEAPALCAGSGAVRFRQQLASPEIEIPDDADPVHRVSARHICALAAAAGEADPGPVAPIYLRPPDAERWRERDSLQAAD